eukprot:1840316-Rhodomonas_salina.1
MTTRCMFRAACSDHSRHSSSGITLCQARQPSLLTSRHCLSAVTVLEEEVPPMTTRPHSLLDGEQPSFFVTVSHCSVITLITPDQSSLFIR